MSCSTGSACVVQTCAFTAVDAFLTAGASSSFFVCVSQPYAVFALDDADLTLVGASSLNATSTTTGTATIDRRGDKLNRISATFSAKGVMNCTTAACTMGGRTGTPAGVEASATPITRGIVGGLGPKEWVTVQSGATAGFVTGADDVAAETTSVVVALAAGLRAGDRITLTPISIAGEIAGKPHTTLIDNIDGTTVDLVGGWTPAGGATDGTFYITAEREINRGSKDCGSNPFISEESDIMGFTGASVDGSAPDAAGSTGLYFRGPGGDPRDLAAYWRPFAPCVLIESASLLSGSQCLDSIGTSMLIIYQELFVGQNKLGVRSANASRDPSTLKRWALQNQEWEVILPFHMSTSYCKSLSLVSICLHNLKLQLKYRGFVDGVANGCGGSFSDFSITGNDVLGGGGGANATVNTMALTALNSITPVFNASGTLNTAAMPSTVLAGSHVVPGVRVRYIYAGKAEREQEVNLTEKIVVVEHQSLTNQLTTTSGGALTTQLGFSHPIAALFITAVSNMHSKRGDLFNFDGAPDPLTFNRANPRASLVSHLKTGQLKFNSGGRSKAHTAVYFREIQPGYVAETPITGTDILSYFFCCGSPYSHQMSGSANFARLDRVEFVYTPEAWVVADQSNAGGLNGSSTSAGVGTVSGGNLLNITYDVVSINVWTTENCMLGRFFA